MQGKYSAAPFLRLAAFAAVAAIAAAPISALASCARKTAAPAAPGTTAPAAAPAKAPEQPRAQAAPQEGDARLQAKAAVPVVPLAASLRAFGLRAGEAPRIAGDFSLGPLQSLRPAKGDEAEAFAVAVAFAEGIASGKLDKALLLPKSRDALSVLLALPAPSPGSQAATHFRLGAIELRGPDASLRIRLPGAVGAARREGLLSLRKEGEAWYVEALSLGPPDSAPLAFNPYSSAVAAGRAP